MNNLTPVSPVTFNGLEIRAASDRSGTGGVAITLANQAGIKGAFFGNLTARRFPIERDIRSSTEPAGRTWAHSRPPITFTNPILNWRTNQTVAASIDRSQNFHRDDVDWRKSGLRGYLGLAVPSTS